MTFDVVYLCAGLELMRFYLPPVTNQRILPFENSFSNDEKMKTSHRILKYTNSRPERGGERDHDLVPARAQEAGP